MNNSDREIQLEWILNNDNESQFKIDGKTVSQTKYLEILKEFHLSPFQIMS